MVTRARAAGRSVVVVGAVLALAACAGGSGGGPGAPTAPPDSIPARLDLDARTLPFHGLEPFGLAVTSDRASSDLTVWAVGSDDGGGPCGPPVLRLHAEETADVIRISVAGYQEEGGPDLACPAIAYGASPHHVGLGAPIGARAVVDGGTGEAVDLVDGSTVPDIDEPPEPFAASVLGREEGTVATRTWSAGEDGPTMSLVAERPEAVRERGPYGRVVARPDVRGTEGAVHRSGSGRYTERTVQWTPNDALTITLRLGNGGGVRWSDDDAIAIARSVTGYETGATDRLPQPATPGTAVATFSSADGAVHGSEQFWKSSGMYLGVACRGEGTVRITIRGERLDVACGERLRETVERSDGSNVDPFLLDVDATEGVRWTVVLARASLDGS